MAKKKATNAPTTMQMPEPSKRRKVANGAAPTANLSELRDRGAETVHKNLRAENTRKAYLGQVNRGKAFLRAQADRLKSSPETLRLEMEMLHIIAVRENPGRIEQFNCKDVLDEFSMAFTGAPNIFSPSALHNWITQKCGEEGCGLSTAESINAAFLEYWDNM